MGHGNSALVRIIAGNNKGMRLKVPSGLQVRPTPDRVREALFSSLGSRVLEARVLDLYAGSGALGLEALSRGATHATFIESANSSLGAIRHNLEATRESADRYTVLKRDVCKGLRALKTGAPFDLVFMDPPYGQELIAPTLELLVSLGLVAKDGLIVVDHPKRETVPDGEGWLIRDRRVYGEVALAWIELNERRSR